MTPPQQQRRYRKGDVVRVDFEVLDVDEQEHGNILRLAALRQTKAPSGVKYHPEFVVAPCYIVRDDVLPPICEDTD